MSSRIESHSAAVVGTGFIGSVHVEGRVQVKAAGGVRDLDGLIKVRDLGATRCGATATAAMLDTYRLRQQASAQSFSPASIGTGGY